MCELFFIVGHQKMYQKLLSGSTAPVTVFQWTEEGLVFQNSGLGESAPKISIFRRMITSKNNLLEPFRDILQHLLMGDSNVH